MNAISADITVGLRLSPRAMRVALTPSTSDDADDALRAARGDTAAFERLYHRYYERVHTLARRMVGPDDADDAAQDAFFRAWTKLASYRADAAFTTWLHRVALNVLIRRASRVRLTAQTTVSIADQAILAPPSSTDASLDLESALAMLPPDFRVPVVLHDLEGYSHEEIGRLLGISLTAARMRLYRARLMLRALARP
jgi:RNA polymerase sigma-70 factor (ECF subfamily)